MPVRSQKAHDNLSHVSASSLRKGSKYLTVAEFRDRLCQWTVKLGRIYNWVHQDSVEAAFFESIGKRPLIRIPESEVFRISKRLQSGIPVSPVPSIRAKRKAKSKGRDKKRRRGMLKS